MNRDSLKKNIYIFLLILGYNLIYSQNKDNQGIFQLPDGTFVAAIKTLDFKSAVQYEDKQRQNMWCWATCVAMTLRFQGLNVTQENVVDKVFNRLANMPGNGNDMVKGANGWQINGKIIQAYVNNDHNPRKIIDDLANKYPLVVGINNPNSNIGHAYVLTAIYFKGDKQGNIYPIKITLRDPWPYGENEIRPYKIDADYPNRLFMSWEEFVQKVNTIVHITF